MFLQSTNGMKFLVSCAYNNGAFPTTLSRNAIALLVFGNATLTIIYLALIKSFQLLNMYSSYSLFRCNQNLKNEELKTRTHAHAFILSHTHIRTNALHYIHYNLYDMIHRCIGIRIMYNFRTSNWQSEDRNAQGKHRYMKSKNENTYVKHALRTE